MLGPKPQIWPFDSNSIIFINNLKTGNTPGWQMASTLHANPDKMENILEMSLEGHGKDSEMRIGPFR